MPPIRHQRNATRRKPAVVESVARSQSKPTVRRPAQRRIDAQHTKSISAWRRTSVQWRRRDDAVRSAGVRATLPPTKLGQLRTGSPLGDFGRAGQTEMTIDAGLVHVKRRRAGRTRSGLAPRTPLDWGERPPESADSTASGGEHPDLLLRVIARILECLYVERIERLFDFVEGVEIAGYDRLQNCREK